MNPYVIDEQEADTLHSLEVEVCMHVDADEQWSYVGNKKNQRWLWYVRESISGIILAYTFGRRKDEVFEELQSSLSHLPIKHWYTDNWATYSRAIPVWQGHSSHKMYMQKSERQNLNFRTHIKRLGRKTICFSKSEEVHDKVIGAYIEEYCFKAGTFKKAMEMRGKENKKTDHL